MNIDETNKNYEIGFLARTEQAKEKLVKILDKHQLSLIKDDEKFSQIKLAYPIKKENFAYFGCLYFSGAPKNIKELNDELKFLPEFLRFIIISQQAIIKKIESGGNKSEPVISEKIPVKLIQNKPLKIISKTMPKIEALSNEELGKKLEEILR